MLENLLHINRNGNQSENHKIGSSTEKLKETEISRKGHSEFPGKQPKEAGIV